MIRTSGNTTILPFFPALVLLLSLIAMPPPSFSQTKTYCSEPVQPFCVDQSGVFEDATARERCSIEVEKYMEEIGGYLGCLDALQKEVRQQAEGIRKHFSCKSGNEKDCP